MNMGRFDPGWIEAPRFFRLKRLPARLAPAATTSTSETAAAAPTKPARRRRSGFVHRNAASAEVGVVELVDGCLSCLFRGHFHESETPGPTGRLIAHHADRINRTCLGEEILELGLLGVKRQISDKQLPIHASSFSSATAGVPHGAATGNPACGPSTNCCRERNGARATDDRLLTIPAAAGFGHTPIAGYRTSPARANQNWPPVPAHAGGRLEYGGSAGGTSMLSRVQVIGRGRVGGAVAERLLDRGVLVEADPDAVVLCVPDRVIADVAGAIAPGPWVCHVSGATPLSHLAPHVRRFSLHPLQTFTRKRGAEQLDGAWAAVTAATPEADEAAQALAGLLGLRTFELDDDRRAIYHAGAVMASNYLVTLYRAAARAVARADVPPEALLPLMRRTLENGFELTGPIARGDLATVEGHLDALRRELPDLEPMYRALAEVTTP